MSFVSEDHKLCFIHIPKSAGTSISNSLVSLLRCLPGQSPPWGRRGIDAIFAGRGHATIADYYTMFDSLPGWSFSMIRDPHKRCISAFMVHPDYGRKMMTKSFANNESMLYFAWEKYLDYCDVICKGDPLLGGVSTQPELLMKNSLLNRNGNRVSNLGPAIHALPCSYFLSIDNKVVVNNLIKMKNIEKVPKIISKNTGIKIGDISHENKSNSSDFVKLLLDKKSKQRIQEIYAKDFELYEGAE